MASRKFKITIDRTALIDIQAAKEYYENKQKGLGKRFAKVVKSAISKLSYQPFYQVKYKKVRCAPIPPFPYLIHFLVSEEMKTIKIFGVIHTSLNPESTWLTPLS